MPSVNLFLPPLLGGFIFVSLWIPLRYWSQRAGGYKLVYAASVAGGLFLLLAHFLILGLRAVTPFQQVLGWWYGAVPVDQYSAQAVLGFLLGVTLWWPLNLLRFPIPALRVHEVVRRQILQSGDPLEITLFRHLGTQELLSITLRSGKVYVGRVVASINPARRVESVRLSLVRSGYRDELTHELTLNVDYEATHERVQARIEEVYARTIDEVLQGSPDLNEVDIMAEVYRRTAQLGEISALAHTFEVVIMAREIVSVSSFNPELYEAYFLGRNA